MIAIVIARRSDDRGLERTQASLCQADLHEIRAVVPGVDEDLGTALNRTLQAIEEGSLLLLWAGEQLAGVPEEPPESGWRWLWISDRSGERRAELRIVRLHWDPSHSPNLRFSRGSFPTIVHAARFEPWSGSAPGGAVVHRDSPPDLGGVSLPARTLATPPDLLEAARHVYECGRFRRAAALAAAVRSRVAPEAYLAWEAAVAEAQAWEALGEFERSVRVLRESLLYHPGGTGVRFRLGWCLIRMGRFTEAAGELQSCLEEREVPWYYHAGNAPRWKVSLALAAAREAAGDLPGAARSYGEAFRQNGALSDALYRMAGCLSRAGRSAAIRGAVSALADGTDPQKAMLLADILSIHGRYTEAVRAVAQVERHIGATQETAYFRAYGLLMQRRFAAARSALERIGPASSLYGHALLLRLQAAWAEDDWPEATVCLRRLAHAGVARPIRSFYAHLHRLLVEGGWFWQVPASGRHLGALQNALLSLLHTFWKAGRPDLSERLLLLIPMLRWPQGHREAGLLAVQTGLAQPEHGASRRCLLETAERLLNQVEDPDAYVRLAQARALFGLGRSHETCRLVRQLPEPPWEAYGIWAQALVRLGERIAGRNGKERKP